MGKTCLILLVLVLGCVGQDGAGTQEAYFCPEDDCLGALTRELENAGESIHCAVYIFTLESVADLIIARSREVDVKIVIEKNFAASKYSRYGRLKENRVDIRIDSNSDLMHNKFCVVDGKVVITGSMNWSKAGIGKNNENLVVIYSKELAEKFEEDFRRIWGGYGV